MALRLLLIKLNYSQQANKPFNLGLLSTNLAQNFASHWYYKKLLLTPIFNVLKIHFISLSFERFYHDHWRTKGN